MPSHNSTYQRISQGGSICRRWVLRNKYFLLIAILLLFVVGVIDFSPPPFVRNAEHPQGVLVGTRPNQDFSEHLQNPNAVQVRVTLRSYSIEPELFDLHTDIDNDQVRETLSQPVLITLMGMDANVDQTIQLENSQLEVDVHIQLTPRSMSKKTILEYYIWIESRRHRWWSREPLHRVHVHNRGLLYTHEANPHHLLFTVDDHILRIDLEAKTGSENAA